MTLLTVLLKALIVLGITLIARDFCRRRDIQGIAFPAAAVLFLCFGIWEMGQ